jgi:hypothetical protein
VNNTFTVNGLTALNGATTVSGSDIGFSILAVSYATLTTSYPCNSSRLDRFATLLDSNVNTFLAVPTASGAYNLPVFCDGTSWKVF